jgi:pyrimidine deaminase RibD-like protein/very-short-patch-repair endonuclease
MRGPQEFRTNRARSLRQSDNQAESRLWLSLRNRNLNGHKFVRQLGIGPYFADFACREKRLVVELDGSQHADSGYDQIRNQYMNEAGWSVARFWSGDVLSQIDAVRDTIAAVCDGDIRDFIRSFDFQFYPAVPMPTAPHPNPLPAGGERGQSSEADATFMRQALVQGLSQMGLTWPNPPVGCVIVKNGKLVSKGATGDGGRPHAEEIALKNAGKRAQGATAYVTLEPCGARSSGAPSCSEKLVAAGVARVVYACADPSPFASHKGPERLKAAGVIVESGLMSAEAEILILGFVNFLKTGLPMVHEIGGKATFDAEFVRNPALSAEDDLRAWAAKGYRHLFVRPGTPAAADLRTAGLSVLPPEGESDESVGK